MQTFLIYVFWFFFLILFYAYIGYPLCLYLISLFRYKKIAKAEIFPSVSIICPVYNESRVLNDKIINTLNLDYPKKLLQIIIVSDASTDGSDEIIHEYEDQGVLGLRLSNRSGKAAALNLGLKNATNDIVIFTDASILINPNGLKNIVTPFADSSVGCVSGEDYIGGSAGEGLYGKYELALRNLESKIGSIVGASGCFYAQRSSLIKAFPSGMAPDFYSVLITIQAGLKAITESTAKGEMKHVQSIKNEFQRKTRTLIRGMTTLFAFKHLLNPRIFTIFSFFLWSHKILRWSCGFFQCGLFITNIFLFSPFWLALLLMQITFYGFAVSGYFRLKNGTISILERLPLFLCVANFAAIHAWIQYFRGYRQEIWEPSKR